MQKFKEWWGNNVTGTGDSDFSSDVEKEEPQQSSNDIDVEFPELPDFPDAPSPNESMGDYAKDVVTGSAQGFFIGAITEVLKHVIRTGSRSDTDTKKRK